MNRTAWLFIVILLLTNVTTIVYYKSQETSAEVYYFLKMMGQSDTWQVSDYEVAMTPHIKEQGAATVTYRGKDPHTVLESITVEVYDSQSSQPFHTSKMRALDDQHSFTTGGSSGPRPSSERILKASELEKTFMRIKWQTKDGQSHEEDIPLHIDSSLAP